MLVACGPPGLQGGKNILFHNNGDGTFTDVSEKVRHSENAGTYGLGVLVADFDNDGWPDIYVANDSTSSALYKNNHDGTFTDIAIEAGVAFSADGKPQAGMGVSAADYDGDGNFDIVKTNFAGDTSSLYRNLGRRHLRGHDFPGGPRPQHALPRLGRHVCSTSTTTAGPDILVQRPRVSRSGRDGAANPATASAKCCTAIWATGNFEDVSLEAGPGILETVAGRGCAVGDFDNDGDLDVVVNCVNDVPQLLRCDSTLKNNWIKVKTVGTKSNRSGHWRAGLSARADRAAQQMDEVRSGGSYISQSDLRVHFGLGRGRDSRSRGALAQRTDRQDGRHNRQPGGYHSGRQRNAMNRRDILGALASAPLAMAAPGANSDGMIYRTLGKTGERVRRSAWAARTSASRTTSRRASGSSAPPIDRGINFMDNCWDYANGKCEVWMGKALRDGYRKKVFLMTKFDGRTKAATAKQIDEIAAAAADGRHRPDAVSREYPHGRPGPLLRAERSARSAAGGEEGRQDPLYRLHRAQGSGGAPADAGGGARSNKFHFDSAQMPLNILDAQLPQFRAPGGAETGGAGHRRAGMKPLASGAIPQNNIATRSSACTMR